MEEFAVAWRFSAKIMEGPGARMGHGQENPSKTQSKCRTQRGALEEAGRTPLLGEMEAVSHPLPEGRVFGKRDSSAN